MAEVERPVMVVTKVAMATIKQARAAKETQKELYKALEMKKICNTINSFLAGRPITLRVLWKVAARRL